MIKMHTPEPWGAQEYGGIFDSGPIIVQLNTREKLARVYHSKKLLSDGGDPLDNARLMAASPGLLKACQIALDRLNGLTSEDLEDDQDEDEDAKAQGYEDAKEYRWFLSDEGFRWLLESALSDAESD